MHEQHINKKYIYMFLSALVAVCTYSILKQTVFQKNDYNTSATIIKAQNCSKGSTCFDYKYEIDGKSYTGNGSVSHPIECLDYPTGCANKKCRIKYNQAHPEESTFVEFMD